MKRLVLRLGIVVLSLICALLLSEMLLRVFWNPPVLDSKYKRDNFSWMDKFVVLNNFGYRDQGTTIAKSENTFRIYSLGDSFTYGWYIDDPNLSYPNVLEKKLNELFGKDKVEVINAGNPGFKIQDSLDRFRSEGILFSPDIVTLGINLFDLTNKEFRPSSPKLSFLTRLKLYELIFGNAERARIASLTKGEIDKILIKDSVQLKANKKLIEELGSLVAKASAILIIVVFPEYNPSNPNEPYPYEEFHNKIKDIVSEINSEKSYNIKIVDLLEAFGGVPDKKELVLNPTDNHPTIKANEIAASEIIKEFDFDNFFTNHKPVFNEIKSKTARINESLGDIKGIIGLEGSGNRWVYFDRVNDLGVQRKILENTGERKIPFMIDFLKTAKFYTHEGWPGAQLELHFPRAGEIIMDKKYLGYEIIGVHQVTSFKRENGSTLSENLDLSDLEITRDNQNIRIKILLEGSFDFHRVYFDVAVKQMDIDSGKVVSFFETDLKKASLKKDSLSFSVPTTLKVTSLPVFIGSEDSYNYIWTGDVLRRAKLTKKENLLKGEINTPAKEDVTVEIPVAEEFKESIGPTVIYI